MDAESAQRWAVMVEESPNDDPSFVVMNQEKMKEMEVYRGDSVLLRGHENKNSVTIVVEDDTGNCPINSVLMCSATRQNLNVAVGDSIVITTIPEIHYGRSIVIGVDANGNGDPDEDLLANYIQPFFYKAFRPVHQGDVFKTQVEDQAVSFRVVSTDPEPYCIVAPDTRINFEGEPIPSEESCPSIGIDNNCDPVMEDGELAQQRFLVEESPVDDPSVVTMNQEKMTEMNFERGDPVLLRGNENKDTITTVLSNEHCQKDSVQMGPSVRRNLNVQLGDSVHISTTTNIKYGTRIVVAPAPALGVDVDENEDPDPDLPDEDLLTNFIVPFFYAAYRPVHQGDVFTAKVAEQEVSFRIVATDPEPYCIVSPDTQITFEVEVVEGEEDGDDGMEH